MALSCYLVAQHPQPEPSAEPDGTCVAAETADGHSMDAASVANVNALVEAMTAPAQTAQAIDVAVLGQFLDTARIQGAAVVESMRDTLDPAVGGLVDISG